MGVIVLSVNKAKEKLDAILDKVQNTYEPMINNRIIRMWSHYE